MVIAHSLFALPFSTSASDSMCVSLYLSVSASVSCLESVNEDPEAVGHRNETRREPRDMNRSIARDGNPSPRTLSLVACVWKISDLERADGATRVLPMIQL
jgi:hypothetical protein